MTVLGFGVRRAVSRRVAAARPLFLLGLGAALALGCSPTQNVRALRAYAYEDPNLPVAIDRVKDLYATLDLVDRLLLETPYTPGDEWIQKLPLSDREAERIREQIRGREPYTSREYEVPILKIYRIHLERVLLDVRRSKPKYDLDAEPEEDPKEESSSYAPEDIAARQFIAVPGKPVKPEDIDLDEEEEPPPKKPGSSDKPSASDSDVSPDTEEEEEDAPRSAGSYPNLFKALASLDPKLASLEAQWNTYAKRQRIVLLAKAQLAEAEKQYPSAPFFLPQADHPAVQNARASLKAAEKQAEETGASIQANIQTLKEERPRGDDQRTIAKDALIITSVLARIEMEALAMVPIISVQAARLVPNAPAIMTGMGDALEASASPSEVASDLTALPTRVTAIEERLSRQLAVLEPLGNALASYERKNLEDTAGFAWKESAVDQVAGITFDSLRVDLAGGAEAFFYSGLGADEQRSSDKVSYDYTGRTRKLDYEVSPILLATAHLRVNFDWLQLPDAAGLDLGFATDRVFNSGGSIEKGSLGNELGAEGLTSEAINIGLAVLGVKTNVRIANFNAGEAVVRDVATDAEVARAPFKFKMTQIDIGYDLSFAMGEGAGRAYIEELVVGGRYFDYQLPRILYEFQDTNPSPDQANYAFLRQSPPQFVNSKYYMAGVTARFGPGETKQFAPFFDMALYLGGGPTSYYFLTGDPLTTGPDVEQNRERASTTAVAADLGFGLGARYRVFKTGSRLRLYINGVYRAELIGSSLTAGGGSEEDNRAIDFGGSDLFHGPEFTFSGAF
ncbi:MAG: hypothetical protein KC492_38325 [Myxococcales bacterium]|nr:hypothetical protein [Myxococcales bacterium]